VIQQADTVISQDCVKQAVVLSTPATPAGELSGFKDMAAVHVLLLCICCACHWHWQALALEYIL
jgi:hypothetical protein